MLVNEVWDAVACFQWDVVCMLSWQRDLRAHLIIVCTEGRLNSQYAKSLPELERYERLIGLELFSLERMTSGGLDSHKRHE